MGTGSVGKSSAAAACTASRRAAFVGHQIRCSQFFDLVEKTVDGLGGCFLVVGPRCGVTGDRTVRKQHGVRQRQRVGATGELGLVVVDSSQVPEIV